MKGHIIKVLKQTQSDPVYMGAKGDRAYVYVLLNNVFTKEELSNSDDLDEAKINLVRGENNLTHHIKSNTNL